MKRFAVRLVCLIAALSLTVGVGALFAHAEGLHTLSVFDGFAVVGGADAATATAALGETVSLRAEALKEGRAFSHWYASPEAGSFADFRARETVYTMPDEDVSVHAVYRIPVSITGVSVATKPYDGLPAVQTGTYEILRTDTNPATPVTLATTDLVLRFTSTDGGLYDSDVPPTGAGDYQLVVSVALTNADYTGSSAPVAFSIQKKQLTLTGVTAADKTYDGTNAVTLDLSAAALSAPIGTDEVLLDPAAVVAAAAENEHAGNQKPVAITGLALSGAQAGNYSVAIPTDVVVNILPYVIASGDVVWSGDAERNYDATASSVTAELLTSVYKRTGDALTLTVTGGDAVHAGTHTASVSALFGVGEGDYALPTEPLTKAYTIRPKPIAIDWSNFASRAYDRTASNVTAAIHAGELIGTEECTLTITGGNAVNAGTHTATATLPEGCDYAIPVGSTQDYEITPVAITPTAATLADKVYDGTTDATVTSVSFSGVLEGDTLVPGVDFSVVAALSSPDASAAPVPATVTLAMLPAGPLGTNYTLTTATVGATAAVSPKPIEGTVTASAADTNLSGTVNTGDVATFDASGITPSGAITGLTVQWKRNGAAIAGRTETAYTLTDADAGQLISVEVTGTGNYTGSRESAGIRAGTRQLTGAISFSGSVTPGGVLTAVPSLDGGNAVFPTHFTLQWYFGVAAIPNATGLDYTVREEDLGKTITVTATAVPGESAPYTGSVSASRAIPALPPAQPVADAASATGQITVSWNVPSGRGSDITHYTIDITAAGGAIFGSPFTIDKSFTSQTVTGLTGGMNYTVTVTAHNAIGSTASLPVTVLVKGAYTGATPAAPTRLSRTTSKVTLTPHNGYEYSQNGTTWQDSNVFSGLSAGKSYTFYQRVKATSTHDASPTSPKYSCYTLAESDDTGDDDTPTSTAKPSATATPKPAEEKLYEIVATESNSNILFSVMNKLVAGNQEKAVAIRFPSVVYSFAKGALSAQSGRVWYDLGTAFDSGTAYPAIQQLGGDALVRMIHFNFDGQLPGEASIRILVGTEYANRTLWYYKYDAVGNALVFRQTTTVDSAGWATVTQSSCSDYAFTSRDVLAAAVTPTPTPTVSGSPSPTPTATPLVAPAKPVSGFNWPLIAIIGGTVLVIIGILWLLLKRRDEAYDEDEDDEDDEEEY